MANDDLKTLNGLFKEMYPQRFKEDVTVADTPITRKLYPKAEKLENGELKIGERSLLPESGPLLAAGRRTGKSAAVQMQILNDMVQYGLLSPPKLSEDTDEGEDKE